MINFSVIIPCYNAEQHIEECLESILTQKDRCQLEIIVVNDNSTDNTRDILEKYSQSKYITLINNDKNQGQFVSRNLGAQIARGKYVLFVDADDYLEADCFERLHEKISRLENVDLVLFSRVNFVKSNQETKIKKYKNIKSCKDMYLDEKHINFIRNEFLTTDKYNSICTKLISRDLLVSDTQKYSEFNLTNAEDRIKSYFLFDKAKKIIVSNDCLYYYRYNPNSFTKQSRDLTKIRHYFNQSIFYLDNKYTEKWGLEHIQKKVVKKSLKILYIAFKKYVLQNCTPDDVVNAFINIDWGSIYPKDYLIFLETKLFFRKRFIKTIITKNRHKLLLQYNKIKIIHYLKHPLKLLR